jgi:Na+-transporting NADH:ubiquinone oxidoreductase subunit NqrC
VRTHTDTKVEKKQLSRKLTLFVLFVCLFSTGLVSTAAMAQRQSAQRQSAQRQSAERHLQRWQGAQIWQLDGAAPMKRFHLRCLLRRILKTWIGSHKV